MKKGTKKTSICSRGHRFVKTKARPVCPLCWPGYYEKAAKHGTGKGKGKNVLSSYSKYHNDGSIWAKGSLLGDKMHGYWEWFRKDGSKMRSGYFVLDKQAGDWVTYDKRGNAVRTTEF